MGRAWRGRAVIEERACRVNALVVTIDTRYLESANAIIQWHEGIDQRRTILRKSRFYRNNSRPGWLISYLLDGGCLITQCNGAGQGECHWSISTLLLAESAVTWADLSWIREIWKGPTSSRAC